MSPPDQPVPSNGQSFPSAFPVLSDNPDSLPEIPGGWRKSEIVIGEQILQLHQPTDPDLFLDDEKVHSENAKNDYMPYWAFLWPSSVPMASAVLNAPWPVGSSVLELGAGIGLVGLAAALRGDDVTFSDYDRTALHLCRVNARLNNLKDPELLFLDWRDVPQRTFEVLIGCEVTYDAQLHDALLSAIDQLMEPNGICWLGDPGRYQAQFFFEKAKAKGFQLRLLNAEGQQQQSLSSGAFQILELRKP